LLIFVLSEETANTFAPDTGRPFASFTTPVTTAEVATTPITDLATVGVIEAAAPTK